MSVERGSAMVGGRRRSTGGAGLTMTGRPAAMAAEPVAMKWQTWQSSESWIGGASVGCLCEPPCWADGAAAQARVAA